MKSTTRLTVAVLFLTLSLLMVPSAFAQFVQARRHAAIAPEVQYSFTGAIDLDTLQTGGYDSWFHVFVSPEIPVGMETVRRVFAPDGTLYHESTSTITVAGLGPSYQGMVLTGPLPATWTSGYVTEEAVVTYHGKERLRLTATIPVSGTSTDTSVEAIVDAAGGVLLVGVFTAPITVVAPYWANTPVPLIGGNYIPPDVIGHGLTLITVSTAVDGNPANRFSRSMKVLLP